MTKQLRSGINNLLKLLFLLLFHFLLLQVLNLLLYRSQRIQYPLPIMQIIIYIL